MFCTNILTVNQLSQTNYFFYKSYTMFIHKMPRHFMLLLFDMKEEVDPGVFLSLKT